MKEIVIKFNQKYKSYNLNSKYCLKGDLIILSGVNGSGKSQLLRAIANPENSNINRELKIVEDGKNLNSENVLLLSFRDNINLGASFGNYNINFREATINSAYAFYSSNIYKIDSNPSKMARFNNGTIIMNGINRLPYWRCAEKLVYLLKEKYSDSKLYNLTKEEFIEFLPPDFVWQDNNNIITRVSNIFYAACCKRVDEQIAYSKRSEIFDNNKWLENAPWTVLNELFNELNFKYSFKIDYEFITPNMSEIPQLREFEEIRGLEDLSDGEKAILKLALVSLDNENYPDLSFVLFDEYDATLNPSLIEKFYYVIEKFFINKGIGVIISTHSSSTISLSPTITHFYEIFPQKNSSPEIKPVSRYEYAELEIANRSFYNKLKDQEGRNKYLEERNKYLESVLSESPKNTLYVEDEYCQIYKIAFLKIFNQSNIDEDNFESIFREKFNFNIKPAYGADILYNGITSPTIDVEKRVKSICLFDFDKKGIGKIKKIRDIKDSKGNKQFNVIETNISKGYTLEHISAYRYAMLLPIPDRLKKYTNIDAPDYNHLAIENLLPKEYIENNNTMFEEMIKDIYRLRKSYKKDFWKELLTLDKEYFIDFEPLLEHIKSIFS